MRAGPSVWRAAAWGILLQGSWLALAAAAWSVTLRIEGVLDALGAGPAWSARTLDAWALLPPFAVACVLGRRIARDRAAGRPARALACAALALSAALVAGFFFGHREFLLHRFAAVREGVLYRSAQMGQASLGRIFEDHGIQTLVVLVDSPEVLERERAFSERHGVRFVHVPMNDPARGASRFLEIVRDPARHPVLVHCEYGIGRTGIASAVFRMEFDGWDGGRALAEARLFGGYDAFENGSSGRQFILSYAPRPGFPSAAVP